MKRFRSSNLPALRRSWCGAGTANKIMNQTQNERIAFKLAETLGEWVSMIDLWKCSGSMNVHSRISDLRKSGMIIENLKERSGRSVHSFYRLILK